jgi:1,4-dihydroxy-6-naphthoate synthase
LIKLSLNCLPNIIETYQLLPIASTLGFHCGPKVIAKTLFPLSSLSEKTIAVPGKETTAHLLLSRLPSQPQKKVFCRYHEIQTLIDKEEVDGGVIIHESRFTYRERGYVEIADLGEIWHSETSLPLPLGGIAVQRTLPDSIKQHIVRILGDSLLYAHRHPKNPLPFILHHSQEKDPLVVQKHISTYVTSESAALSQKGVEAIETLLHLHPSQEWLYDR